MGSGNWIVDNLNSALGTWNDKLAEIWTLVSTTPERIEVFYLPAYSPELNPDEYLNHALKLEVHSGDLPFSARDIDHKIRSFLLSLQKKPDQVSAFFRHPCVSYI